MYAYCYFCETQKCSTIAALIRRTLNETCFSPEIIQRKWTKGICEEIRHPWLPGYIFVYTSEIINPRFPIDGIIRCLGNEELQGQDRDFAVMLYHKNGVIGSAPLVQEGERCVLVDPSWQGMHGTIIRMDRGRQRCCIEFEFDGISRTIWVGYDLVNTESSENQQ